MTQGAGIINEIQAGLWVNEQKAPVQSDEIFSVINPDPAEEVLGPVVGILGFDRKDQLAGLVNASKFSLSAEIWAGYLSRAHRLAIRLSVSDRTINRVGGLEVEAPLREFKQSGFGPGDGRDTTMHYTHVKNDWGSI